MGGECVWRSGINGHLASDIHSFFVSRGKLPIVTERCVQRVSVAQGVQTACRADSVSALAGCKGKPSVRDVRSSIAVCRMPSNVSGCC